MMEGKSPEGSERVSLDSSTPDERESFIQKLAAAQGKCSFILSYSWGLVFSSFVLTLLMVYGLVHLIDIQDVSRLMHASSPPVQKDYLEIPGFCK